MHRRKINIWHRERQGEKQAPPARHRAANPTPRRQPSLCSQKKVPWRGNNDLHLVFLNSSMNCWSSITCWSKFMGCVLAQMTWGSMYLKDPQSWKKTQYYSVLAIIKSFNSGELEASEKNKPGQEYAASSGAFLADQHAYVHLSHHGSRTLVGGWCHRCPSWFPLNLFQPHLDHSAWNGSGSKREQKWETGRVVIIVLLIGNWGKGRLSHVCKPESD